MFFLILIFISISICDYSIPLQNGVVFGPYGIRKGEYKYFSFETTLKTGIVIMTTEKTGESQIFASCTNPQPNQKNFEWGGGDALIIHTSLSCSKLYISIYENGDIGGDVSIIAYSQNQTISSIELNERIYTHPGCVQEGFYDRYFYTHTKDDMSITFLSTIFNSSVSDADMYMSKHPHPNQHVYDKKSINLKGDEVIRYDVVSGEVLYIAIYGYKGNARYEMSVFSDVEKYKI